ncbi:tigger transposable element-derived protein 3-like [Eublepharis macularius]|uniref:Tigger transposable element-derived protein 3-like n=1 Tax=Eublepharis macularius TaxID=481883 RepID=A0AA97LAW1_EUBMA|nr:tigger transposable element-derived protein 3-like [Eublepharis macularius]
MSPEGKAQLDTCSGEDRHPKRVKEEEGLEMQEAAANPLPGKATKNGFHHHPVSGKSLVEPHLLDPAAAGEEGVLMERRGGSGHSPRGFGTCRAPVGEMPHWCLECGKNFGPKAGLEKHQLNHAGQCPYICSDCGRSFTEHVALPSCRGACPAGSSFSHAGCRQKGLPPPSEVVAHRKERKELSLQEKVRVLEMLEGPKVSQSELAKRFGVSQPQICRIIKNKERILAEWCKNGNLGRKRKLEGKGAANGAALLQWLEQSCVPSLPTNGRQLQEEAMSLSETLGKPELCSWLAGFKSRQKPAQGRARTERQKGERPEEERWENMVLPHFLSRYDPPNVYTCGETGLLFRATPEELAMEQRADAKDQLTVLLCTNLDASDKRDTLIVGKGPKPFCFQGVSTEELPVTYRASSRAWMTAAIFSEWLRKFNEDMKRKQRSVVLFLVQCAAHPAAELSNVKMVFLPPQSSSIRPLERGIIQSFKCHYRRRMLIRLLAVLDSLSPTSPSKLSRPLTLWDAIHMIIQAWSEVCPQTVTNSFRAAGFGVTPRIPAPPGDVVRALGFMNQEQFERFVLVDEGLECFGEQDGAEMASGDQRSEEPTCATAEEEDRAEDFIVPSCPSKAEVMESLAKLRRYFECHALSPAMFQKFYKLEDMVHGMSLAHMQVSRLKALNKE